MVKGKSLKERHGMLNIDFKDVSIIENKMAYVYLWMCWVRFVLFS